ncbi:MAG: hypothetical protein ACP5I3_11325 [Thermoproteus sp.]
MPRRPARPILRKPQLMFRDKLTGKIFFTDNYEIVRIGAKGQLVVEAVSPYTGSPARTLVGRAKLPNSFVYEGLKKIYKVYEDRLSWYLFSAEGSC